MCQLSVVLEKAEGSVEKVMEGVSLVTLTADGVEISAMFDEPQLIKAVRIAKIDMLKAEVTLSPV